MSAQKSKYEKMKIKNNREERFRYALPYLHLHVLSHYRVYIVTNKRGN